MRSLVHPDTVGPAPAVRLHQDGYSLRGSCPRFVSSVRPSKVCANTQMGGFALGRQALAGRFSAAPTREGVCLRGASWGAAGSVWVQPKSREFHRRHGFYFFAMPNGVRNRVGGEFSLSEAPRLDQREFPLLVRAGAPSAAPNQWIRYAKTYRQAVRLAWKFRADEGMTKATLASKAKLRVQLVTDYLNEDDKPSRRNLPADKVADFERVVGNSIVSQWLAAQSQLTVLEELQATRIAA